MTKKEWLGCADPEPMLKWLKEKLSDRKLRLIAVGCCRHLWHLLTEAASREAVEVAERYADGLERKSTLAAARARAHQVVKAQRQANICHAAAYHACHAARDNIAAAVPGLATGVAWTLSYGPWLGGILAVNYDDFLRNQEEVVSLVRDVAGNPFRAARTRSRWRTADVTELATAMYEARAFERMPTLADALEAAGCTNDSILAHCRGPGPHVRGCWVVDQILGKV